MKRSKLRFSTARKKVPDGNKILRTTKDYASSTTVHGISYVFDDRHPIVARLFWTICVILAFSLTTYQMTSLYTQWEDNPVITTLDTVALPIEDIEFPAVTICPQGSVKQIMDNVLFKQLREYIIEKRAKENRRKRSVSGVGISLGNLTYEEMMTEAEEFLKDVYPGAKETPKNFVLLMEADDPEIAVQNEAVLIPATDKTCNQTENMETYNNLNKQLNNDSCPDGFELFDGYGCVHTSPTTMPYGDASDYCKGQGGAELLLIDSDEALRAIQQYDIIGILTNLPIHITYN